MVYAVKKAVFFTEIRGPYSVFLLAEMRLNTVIQRLTVF